MTEKGRKERTHTVDYVGAPVDEDRAEGVPVQLVDNQDHTGRAVQTNSGKVELGLNTCSA
jgi:hypothetical protein